MEDPSLEKVALDDITVFLITVGESSLVNAYSNALPARTPNRPSMTKLRVIRGWAAGEKGKNKSMKLCQWAEEANRWKEKKNEAWHATHPLNREWSVSGAGLVPPAGWRRCTTTGVESHALPPSCRCTQWAPQPSTWCSWGMGCHWDRTCWTAFQNSSRSQKTYERGREQDKVLQSFDKCFSFDFSPYWCNKKVWKSFNVPHKPQN